jgi:molecular chaperone HscB
MDDYFAVFGLPRKLTIDAADLERRFYELSRRHHPDFHQGASAERQGEALEQSALVNRAYRSLRDGIARIEYLVRLEEGREVREGGTARPEAPRHLLEDMLEVQEVLEEARSDGFGAASRARLEEERKRLAGRRAAEEASLLARAAEWDALIDSGGELEPLLRRFKEGLATIAYLRTVIDDITEALEGEPAQHGAHRRD